MSLFGLRFLYLFWSVTDSFGCFVPTAETMLHIMQEPPPNTQGDRVDVVGREPMSLYGHSWAWNYGGESQAGVADAEGSDNVYEGGPCNVHEASLHQFGLAHQGGSREGLLKGKATQLLLFDDNLCLQSPRSAIWPPKPPPPPPPTRTATSRSLLASVSRRSSAAKVHDQQHAALTEPEVEEGLLPWETGDSNSLPAKTKPDQTENDEGGRNISREGSAVPTPPHTPRVSSAGGRDRLRSSRMSMLQSASADVQMQPPSPSSSQQRQPQDPADPNPDQLATEHTVQNRLVWHGCGQK